MSNMENKELNMKTTQQDFDKLFDSLTSGTYQSKPLSSKELEEYDKMKKGQHGFYDETLMENKELKGYFTAGYNEKDNVMYISYIEPWQLGQSEGIWSVVVDEKTSNKLLPLLQDICSSLTEKLL